MALHELLAEVDRLIPGAVVVDDLSNSGRAVLARIAVDGTTYIAKRHNELDAFKCEVEGLRVLPASVRPALVSAGERVVVMEDLGNGPSLATVLLGTDPVLARVALMTWATTLGSALAPSLRAGRREAPLEFGDAITNLIDMASRYDVAAPAGLENDVDTIVATLGAATPWFAFGPSDACPDNNRLFADGTMKLFDFEGASWRHAASEAAYTRAPFCTCWCVGGLPDGTTAAMEDALMAALDPVRPDEFRVAIGVAAVAHVLQTMKYFRQFVEHDSPVAPSTVQAPSTGRQYAHARLEMIAGYAEVLPALAKLSRNLAGAMRDRWPACSPMPMYPAFR